MKITRFILDHALTAEESIKYKQRDLIYTNIKKLLKQLNSGYGGHKYFKKAWQEFVDWCNENNLEDLDTLCLIFHKDCGLFYDMKNYPWYYGRPPE